MATQASEFNSVHVGDVEINFSTSRVRVADTEQAIEPKVLHVLKTLIEAGEEVVTRDTLIDAVWGVKVGGDERLTRSISLLRKALGDKKYIETIPKRGYRLVAPVLINGARNEAAAAPQLAHSIAVLPFEDLGAEADHSFLVEGVSEEILNALNQVPDLKVTGRNSAFVFEHDLTDIPKIADILDVSYVLTGTLRTSNGRLHITVQLLQGTTGQELWSARYERYPTDIFDIQEEIVQSVLSFIGRLFNVLPNDRLASRLTTSPEAYALFSQGRRLVHQLNGQRTIPTGIEFLTRAVEIDSDFAEAWAWLGLAHYILPEFSLTPDWRQHRELSRQAADKALEATPISGMSLLTHAMNVMGTLRFDEAALAFERAMEADPHNVETLAGYSLIMMGLGLPDIAEPYIEQVIRQDPLCGLWHITLGGIHLMRGELQAAEDCFVKSYDLGFGSGALAAAECMARRGEPELAAQFLTANIDGLAPVEQANFRSPIARHFALNAFLHHKPVASKIVDLVLRRRLSKPLAQPTSGIVLGFLFLDDSEAFIRHILEKPNPYVAYSFARVWEPTEAAANIRSNALFPKLIDRLGLKQAWECYGYPAQSG